MDLIVLYQKENITGTARRTRFCIKNCWCKEPPTDIITAVVAYYVQQTAPVKERVPGP